MRCNQGRVSAIVFFALFALLWAFPMAAFANEAPSSQDAFPQTLPEGQIAVPDGDMLASSEVGLSGEGPDALACSDGASTGEDGTWGTADSQPGTPGINDGALSAGSDTSLQAAEDAEIAVDTSEGSGLVVTTDPEPLVADNTNPEGLAAVSQGVTSATEALSAEPLATASFERISGTTALDTMKLIVQKGWSSSKVVVIASEKSYQDALSASALAGSLFAPILLTNPSTLSAQTKSEISRLKATIAYIVGGSKALSSAIDEQLKAMGVSSVVRVKGTTAEDTAVAVANQIGTARSKTCIIASSGGYQDALSIAPYAYKTKSPIFLTDKTGSSLSDSTCKAIAYGNYKSVVIVGGVKAVKEGVESQVRSAGISNITRLRDATAEGTSVAVANWALGQGMKVTYVGIATSKGYQDALSGAALCGKLNAPLVLISDGNRSAVTNYINPRRSSISTGYIFGGRSVITEEMSVYIKTGTIKSAYRNLTGYQIGNYTKLGIDVSRWQGSIDWKKVKAAGIDFAIIGAGYYKSSTNYLLDPYFVQNIKGAKAAGVELGVYLYSYAKDAKGAKAEANHVLSALNAAGVKPADLKYGIYYDLEEPSMQSTSYNSTLLNMTKTFVSTLGSAGYKNVGVYANTWWWTTFLTSSEYNGYNRWVAQYNVKCTYSGSYKMWQFRSTGIVDGISANTVDMNLYYG